MLNETNCYIKPVHAINEMVNRSTAKTPADFK